MVIYSTNGPCIVHSQYHIGDIPVSEPEGWNPSHKASATRDDYFLKFESKDKLVFTFNVYTNMFCTGRWATAYYTTKDSLGKFWPDQNADKPVLIETGLLISLYKHFLIMLLCQWRSLKSGDASFSIGRFLGPVYVALLEKSWILPELLNNIKW